MCDVTKICESLDSNMMLLLPFDKVQICTVDLLQGKCLKPCKCKVCRAPNEVGEFVCKKNVFQGKKNELKLLLKLDIYAFIPKATIPSYMFPERLISQMPLSRQWAPLLKNVSRIVRN